MTESFTSTDNAITQLLKKAYYGSGDRAWTFRHSEKGDTIEYPGVFIARNENPHGYVSQCAIRNANPFFHMAEALWMLAGREDLRFLLMFNSTFGNYSDDGKLIRGSAYGKRWRTWFGKDQIIEVVQMLRKRPDSRQAVMSQWSVDDLGIVSKDIPCNLQTLFLVRDGKLDMTVTNRSNDLLWGMYGSNIVHFSILHHYVAALCDLPIGAYYQVSNCLHVYNDNPIYQRYIANEFNPAYEFQWQDAPLIASNCDEAEMVRQEIKMFFQFFDQNRGVDDIDSLHKAASATVTINPFMETFVNMMHQWCAYKRKEHMMIPQTDAFALAANNFVNRRGKAIAS